MIKLGGLFTGLLLSSVLFASAPPASQAADVVTEVRPGVLPEKWSSGSPHCTRVSPEFQVHQYNEDFFILRESGCVNDEKPFIYLLFGKDKAILFDTGAGSYEVEGKPDVVGAVRK